MTFLSPNSGYPGLYSPQVRTLQQRLRQAGYYGGSIDGIYGPYTRAAEQQQRRADELLLRPQISTPLRRAANTSQPLYRVRSTARIPRRRRAYAPLQQAAAGLADSVAQSGGSATTPGTLPPGQSLSTTLLGGEFRQSSDFGPRSSPTKGASSDHKGVDFAAPIGTPIFSPTSGRVVRANGGVDGFGKWVVVQGDDGVFHTFGHIAGYNVEPGQRINAGQRIATVGNEGRSTGAHLHYETSRGGYGAGSQRFDPTTYYRPASQATNGAGQATRAGAAAVPRPQSGGGGFYTQAAAGDPVARMVEAIARNETGGRQDAYQAVHDQGRGLGRYGMQTQYWNGFQRQAGLGGLSQADPAAQDAVAYGLVRSYYQQALAAGYTGDEAWKQVAIKWNKGSFGSDERTTNNYGAKALSTFKSFG